MIATNDQTDDPWSPADRALALALARGLSRSKAARTCQTSPSTVRRRLGDPEFVVLVRELRTAMLDGAIGRLTRISGKATAELGKLLDTTNEPVKLGAVRLVLDSLIKLRD